MYAVIVEDDPVQLKLIKKALNEEFPRLDIRQIDSESKFIESFPGIATETPEFIVMDIMLRWALPSPNMPPPSKEVLDEGFYRAGLRLVKMLNDEDRTKNIPIILYSVLNKEDIEEDVKALPQAKYLSKDFDKEKIIRAIHASLR